MSDMYFDEIEEPRMDMAAHNNAMLQMFEEKQRLKDDIGKGRFKGMTLPLSRQQVDALSSQDRQFLSDSEADWKPYHPSLRDGCSALPSRDVLIRVSLGKETCPACLGKRRLVVAEYGRITGLARSFQDDCVCVPPTVVQRFMDILVHPEYRECDLRTLAPSRQSCLSQERQAAELEFLKKHVPDNYFFLGPAGTSKTTFATALLRESLWRHSRQVMEYRSFPRPWFCWKVNAEKLFVQNMEWKTSMTSDNPAPPPDVTPQRIQDVSARGLRPTLVIEELDKTKLTESRVNFLFDVIDAMDGCKGQIIITSNRTLDRFLAMFEENENETVRVTGGPLMRRFFKNCHVRNYFESRGQL